MSLHNENGRLALVIFGGIVAAAVFSWWMSLAPNPLPANAPETEFSAYRAFEHVKAMAQEPHPVGSKANNAVADYIVSRLEAWGVEYTYDRPIMQRRKENTVEQINAVLARIPGTDSTGALAIDAHYDSTPYGPGAADDISGCAAMLETIRALKAAPPMKNDILFCFADKEESSGIGGPGVFFEHPWFKEVTAVLGLEARGTSGPALMFETGPENGFLIRQMAQAGVYPRATSIMFDIYDRMPFGSNFTRYKNRELPGLNVAYIDDFAYYHTMLDNPEHLSLASLQHHGAYTLGMSKQLGNIAMDNPRAPNATYFNTLGSHMIIYPRSWNWPLAYAALGLFAATLFFGIARRQVTLRGMLAGIAVFAVSAAIVVTIGLSLAYIAFQVFQERALYRNNMFSLSSVFTGIGVLLLMARLVRHRVRAQSLFAGIALLWAAFLVVVQVYLPGGAYTALWPLCFMTAGLLALVLSPDPDHPGTARLVLAALSALPAVILLAPTYAAGSYTLTSLAMPLFMVLILAVLAAFLPQLVLVPVRRHTQAGLGFFAAGLLFFLTAMISNTPSAERPILNCLSYAVNYDTGEAFYISREAKPDEWLLNYFPEDAPRVSLDEYLGGNDGPIYMKAPAPAAPFGKLQLTVLKDETTGDRRTLQIHVDSQFDAQQIHLQLEPGVQVYAATALGLRLRGAESGWQVSLDTIPYDGGLIELEVEAGKPLVFKSHEAAYELPELPGFIPRPDWMMTQTNRVLFRNRAIQSNHTYAIGTHTI